MFAFLMAVGQLIINNANGEHFFRYDNALPASVVLIAIVVIFQKKK